MDNLYDPKARRDSVEAEARRLGFELFGVTRPDPPPHMPVFERWLEAGRHGSMAYLATERARTRRADPLQILPECRSIVVVGWRYASPPANHSHTLATNRQRLTSPLPSKARAPLSNSYRTRIGEGAFRRRSKPLHPSPKPGLLWRGAGGEVMHRLADRFRFKKTYRPVCRGRKVAPSSGRGRVAAYAWEQDYHDVLPEQLKALVDFIEAQVGEPVPNRWYTDTGPILERDLAMRAGLGWIGKNTCLINPHEGSYFLLAEILLGVELAADAPFVDDRCGTCTRCLEACPTAAILPDRTLDATRCISYLTIELKDALPLELRPQMGNWVFGCDVCQEVCPWNRHSTAPTTEQQPEISVPDLAAELALTPEEFNRKFKGSPVKRAKRRGYLRNVAVALGNSGRPEAVPALSQALLSEAEPLVRRHAAWGLGNLGGESASNTLSRALESEPDPDVRLEIEMALSRETA